MNNTPEECPIRATYDDEEKRFFDVGWGCGYSAGMKAGTDSANITRKAQRYIPLALGVGVAIGMIAMLFLQH